MGSLTLREYKENIFFKLISFLLSDDLLLIRAQQENPEHESILNIMNYAQRGRMEDQCCSLNPVKTGQLKTTPAG